MFRIAALDDDILTLQFIRSILSTEYDLVTFTKSFDFLSYLKSHHVDLIILDVVLPEMDGNQVCAKIRSQPEFNDTPIILLSGKNDNNEAVSAFYIGADDFIRKPFNPVELKARVYAKLRNKSLDQSVIHLKELEIHPDKQKVYINKADSKEKDEIELTRSEFSLLMLLSKNLNNILSREEIIQAIWPNKEKVNQRTVDAHVSNLRRKLKNSQIQIDSVHGEGYVISLPTSVISSFAA